LKVYEMFKGETWLVRLSAGYYGCVHPWKKPIHEVVAPLKHAHRVGLESGDIEFSMICISLSVWNQFDFGPLPKIESEIQEVVELMDAHGQLASRDMIKGVWQATVNLMGQNSSGDVCKLDGEIVSKGDVESWKTSSSVLFVWAQHYEMLLSYLFGRYDEAVKASGHCHKFIEQTLGTTDVSGVVLFAGLSHLAVERVSPKRGRIRRVHKYMRKMERWARHAPFNFLGMQFLLEAELASLRGDADAALSKFLCAIALEKESRALLRVALSHERLGRHLIRLGQHGEGRRYLEEALKSYDEYGAMAKVRHLHCELSDEVVAANDRS
jgi:tetratricopeptide (TPR) repeat protein